MDLYELNVVLSLLSNVRVSYNLLNGHNYNSNLPVDVAKYILENRRMVELVRPVKIRCHLGKIHTIESITGNFDTIF